MPRYIYRAYDAQGALRDGEVNAASRGGALENLLRSGHYTVELLEQQGAAQLKWWQREVFGSARLPVAALSVFSRELACLVNAAVALDESLRIVAMQPMLSRRLRQITRNVLELVRSGQSLSQSLAAQGGAFPEFYCQLVKAGEASGALGQVLNDLAGVLERSAETRGRIGSALIYPAFLVAAAIAAITVIATVLLPAVVPIFEDAGVTPPRLLRAWLGLQSIFADYWMIFSALFASVIGLFLAGSQSPKLKLALDRAVIRAPVIGTLIARRETARFARTMATLIRNGVPILEAVRISNGVLTNREFVRAVNNALDDLKQGGGLAVSLSRAAVFPDLLLRLVGIGEQTGQLDVMYHRVAETYDALLERQIRRLTSLVTPVLTVIIGVIVGGILLSVMTAIFSVNDLAFQ